MTAASALIGGLGGEKIRWTEQSKQFKAQIDRYVYFARAYLRVKQRKDFDITVIRLITRQDLGLLFSKKISYRNT